MTLSLDTLACARAGHTLRQGLTLDLAPGEAAALSGPNGAGKSTLLRMIAGLLPPDSGKARLNGVALSDDPAEYRAALSYAGHLDALKPALTATETLNSWAALFGADDGAVDRALEAFDLVQLRDLAARYFSAGQKRRLGLARLMLTKRPLWLLDEPTVSLDAAATARLCKMIEDHRATGGMALIATHLPLDLADLRSVVLEGPRAPETAGPLTDATLTGDAW